MSKYNTEEKVSDYIDALNNEQKSEIIGTTDDQELEKLMATVRLVRTLREPALPEEGYPHRLAQAVSDKLKKEKQSSSNQSVKSAPKSIRRILPPMAALAASLLMLLLINWFGLFDQRLDPPIMENIRVSQALL